MGDKRRSGARRIFTKYMQEKLAVTVIVITLALFALIYVLYHIITTKQDSYNQIVLSQQQYDSRVLPYRRGDIVDRNGTYLATTEKVYNLIIDSKQIMSAEDDYLDATVTALVTVFGYDETEMRNLIRDNSTKALPALRKTASYDQKEAFEQYQSDTNKANAKADSRPGSRESGLRDEFRRIYPYNSWPATSLALLPVTAEPETAVLSSPTMIPWWAQMDGNTVT